MMFKRKITTNELNYVKRQLKSTKAQLFWMLFIIIAIVGAAAIFVYVTEDSNLTIINIIFGVLILIIGLLHWIFKGYKNYIIDTTVHKGSGYYERIYEYRGQNGSYFDTINGVKVKIPWHWRRYLKAQKDEIKYEYLIRDGAVAINELPNYIISINDKLSLDYELKHGLNKTKPITFLNAASIFLIIPLIIILCVEPNFEDALEIQQVFKNPNTESIIINSAEELMAMTSSNYIQFDNAWVYQFKRRTDIFSGENYILTKTERDKIYNHPSSNLYYGFFTSSAYITKPDKEKLIEALKSSPYFKKEIFKDLDSSLLNKTIEKTYNIQLKDYEKRLNKAQNIENALKELKPKVPVVKIYDNTFNAPEKRSFSIKKSLENTYSVSGFYDPKANKLISIKDYEKQKEKIKNMFILASICVFIMVLALISLVKIILNSRLKLRLVKEQLREDIFKTLPEN